MPFQTPNVLTQSPYLVSPVSVTRIMFKVLLALALGRARHLLRSGGYLILMRSLGLALLGYALLFLYEGGQRLL